MFQCLNFMLDFQTGHQISNVFLLESIKSIVQKQYPTLFQDENLFQTKIHNFMLNNNAKEATIYLALINNNLDLANRFSDCSVYILSCLLSLTEPSTV
jgi:hypothetical protein